MLTKSCAFFFIATFQQLGQQIFALNVTNLEANVSVFEM